MRFITISRIIMTLVIFQMFFFSLVGVSTALEANASGLSRKSETKMGIPNLAPPSNRPSRPVVYLPLILKPAKVVPIPNRDFEQGPIIWNQYSKLGEALIFERIDLLPHVYPYSGDWIA